MKNILLAVVGLTPQVITEALYALHQEGRAVNAIHIIPPGAERRPSTPVFWHPGKGPITATSVTTISIL